MDFEIYILSLMWIAGITAIVFFMLKNRLRESLFALLTCHAFLWVNSLIEAEFGLLSFPIREFPRATDVLFTTDYFFFPLIFAFYMIFEPKLIFVVRFCYLVFWVSGLTAIDCLIERYTDLIEYENYTWYWSWLDFFVIFILSNLIYTWFFNHKFMFEADRRVAE